MSIQQPEDEIRLANTLADSASTGRVEHVQSLERGLAVLSAFTARDTSLTISGVAERTGLSRATARRLLLTLEQLGYVESNRREFSLTPAVLSWPSRSPGPSIRGDSRSRTFSR